MNYKYVLAGAGAALAACGIYYLFQEVECPQDSERIKKTAILQLFKELEIELTPFLISLASFSHDLQKRLGPENSDQLTEILQSHCPVLKDLQRLELTICQKYKITPADLQSICQSDYSQDEEVQQSLQSLNSIKSSAFQGIPPKLSFAMPADITPDMVLNLIKDLYDSNIFVTYKLTRPLVKSGEKFSVSSAKYQEISATLQEETEKIKEKIFKIHNFHTYSLPAKTILQQATQVFKEKPEFVKKLAELEQRFQNSLILITQGKYPEGSFLELAQKFDDRIIWELETPRQIVEEEVFEYINDD